MHTSQQTPEAAEATDLATEPAVTDNRTIAEVPRLSDRTLGELPPNLRPAFTAALAASQDALSVQSPDVLKTFVDAKLRQWRENLNRDFVSSREAQEAQSHFARQAEQIATDTLVEAERKAAETAEAIARAIAEAERPPSLLASLPATGEARARTLAAHAAVAQRIEAIAARATSRELMLLVRHLDVTGQAEACGHLEALAEAELLPQRGGSQEDIEAAMWLTNVFKAKRAARVPESLRAAAAVLAVTRGRLATWRSALASSKAGSTAIHS